MKTGFIFLFSLLFIAIFVQNGKAQSTFSPKWRIAVDGGMGYITSSSKDAEAEMKDLGFTSSSVDSYSKHLKWGGQGSADAYFLFHPNMGVGAKYSFFTSNADISQDFSIPSTLGIADFRIGAEETVYLNYAGPSFQGRIFLNSRRNLQVSAFASVGYCRYQDNATIALSVVPSGFQNMNALEKENTEQYDFKITSNAIGFSTGVGLEYFFTKHIALGMDVSYFYSKFDEFNIKSEKDLKIEDLDLDLNNKNENLSRISASLGLHFYF